MNLSETSDWCVVVGGGAARAMDQEGRAAKSVGGASILLTG